VVGVDEAGRGPWAGPIVAAAVILPPFLRVPGINDSKLLAPEQRDYYHARVRRAALAIGLGIVEVPELDRVGVGRANRWAMLIALHNLGHPFDYLLVDGFPLPERLSPQEHIIDGDRLSISVMAAGIVAKVTRDGLMMRYEERFPGWGFGQHKGYGTPEHQEAIARLGLSPLHRRSFFPVQLAGLSAAVPE
jgi:ribonuclease HII